MAERAYEWSELPHLAQRTLWSLKKPLPDPSGEAWLLGLLSPRESMLYRSMDVIDRAHAVECAQFVTDQADEVIVASALHDVGKTGAGLGTPGRVAASFCGLLIADRARAWTRTSGLRRRGARLVASKSTGGRQKRAEQVSPVDFLRRRAPSGGLASLHD
jgi:hypothetical protein